MGIEYEKGRYRCEVVSQCLTESSKGSPCVEIKFNVMAREIGPNSVSPVNQNIRTWWGYLTEKAIDRTIKDLQTIGIRVDSFSEINDSRSSIIGNEIAMYCGHEVDQNSNPKEKWGVAFTFTESAPLPLDKSRQLDALYGAALKKAKKESAPVAKREPQAAVAVMNDGISDDDVPF